VQAPRLFKARDSHPPKRAVGLEMGFLSLLLAASLGCPLFGNAGTYAQPVANAPVDRNSREYIDSAIEAGNHDGFWISARPVEYLNIADNQTPKYRVRPRVGSHRLDELFPWGAGFRIEPLGDAHAVVLQRQSCKIYELYGAAFAEGVLSAYSGAVWSLDRRFVPLPPGTPSAMASGLSFYAGAVQWSEVASGHIDHALNWAAPAGTVAQSAFVRPASDTDGIKFNGVSGRGIPYGARLRLRASFDISGFGPQSAVIARAMKAYGIYLADTARTNELYNFVAPDGSSNWDAADLSALRSIRISDFDVLSLGEVLQVHGR
jgi:hypothetical protein